MPDIVLVSSDGTPSLTLSSCQRGESGGAQFTLAVSCHGYGGSESYALEAEELTSLVSQLKQMYESCRGAAELRFHYEKTHVKFEFGADGRLVVSGLLVRYEDPRQRLEFAFYSDQSCLRSFIAGLGAV